MADKQILFRGSSVTWVITALVAALGFGVWDLLPGVAIVIVIAVAIAWSAVRLAHGSLTIASLLVSAELGLAISGIVIGVVANAH